MKKNLLIAALAGSFLIPTISQSMIEPGTQAMGAGALILAGTGAAGWAVGHYGVANTIGTAVAGTVGCMAGLITEMAVNGLIAVEFCPALLAANPLVAPILIGSIVCGAMFHKRKKLFPGRLPELENFSKGLLTLGSGLGIATLLCGTANICGYNGISLHSKGA